MIVALPHHGGIHDTEEVEKTTVYRHRDRPEGAVNGKKIASAGRVAKHTLKEDEICGAPIPFSDTFALWEKRSGH